jgi:hypothetical protein
MSTSLVHSECEMLVHEKAERNAEGIIREQCKQMICSKKNQAGIHSVGNRRIQRSDEVEADDFVDDSARERTMVLMVHCGVPFLSR